MVNTELALCFGKGHCAELSYLKVAVGPNLLTNRNLKQIITSECTKTAIFQLLWPLDTSKLVEREFIQYSIIKWIYFEAEAITLAIIWLEIEKKHYK